MKKVDYIVVGLGFAGSCFVLECLKNNKSVIAIDGFNKSASGIAAGVFNPVVLKRFTPIWKAETQLNLLHETLSHLSSSTGREYLINRPVYRIFSNDKEKQTWLEKRENSNVLHHFLSDSFKENTFSHITAPFGFGVVKDTGQVAIKYVIEDIKTLLDFNYLSEEFDYHQLKWEDDFIEYKEIRAHKIIFCEGIKGMENPYFSLPIVPNKGETLIIETDEELPKAIVKGKVFIMPWFQPKQYYVGATYKRDAWDDVPTQKGKEELETKLKTFFTGSYKIIEHRAGIRPTVPDFKPLVGFHPKHKNMGIINGMGTRVTLLAPYSAKVLFENSEENIPIPTEMDIQRFQ